MPHGALYLGDGVAHHASQTGLRFRTINDLLDGSVKHPAVEQRRIVTTRAPFGGFNANDVLHVLHALAVPLVVKGRKVMHGAIPLLIDVMVAALAGIRFHEVISRNFSRMGRLRRTGEEGAIGSVAFVIHRAGRRRRIADLIGALPAALPDLPSAKPERRSQGQEHRESNRCLCGSFCQPTLRSHPACGQNRSSH